jgi:DNA-binding CsgD family transcriptional regulator
LKEHPEILEEIIGEEYEGCMFALQRAKSSGVFMILDATVNPTLDNAKNSKAGLYIKSNEPNIISSSTPNTLILRGPSSIGRQNSITLHSQWRMEFDVSNGPYFNRPTEEAKNRDLSLAQLYYWSSSMTLPGTTEEIMICSVPLIDSKGNIFGVCGFDISAMLFKLSHMPDNNTYRRIFCVFSPYNKDILNTAQAFFSGGYSVRKIAEENQKLTIKYDSSFNSYRQEDRTLFRGLHKSVKLYPKGSVFEDETWTVAMMMPGSDMSTYIMRANFQIGALFMILLSLGILGSYFLSKRYIMPITKSIDIIKSNNFSGALKTNISEIDDLMEFLSSHKEENIPEKENRGEVLGRNTIDKLPTSLFDEFVKNTGTLSPAERAVFNLYVEGYTAKEITGILSLSINTIKTHNKRIYMKLNVTSREELLLYVNMLKEAGREMK